MPNWVTNRISLAKADADLVLHYTRDGDDLFDFEKLVPPPPNMYRGDLSAEDDKDFPTNWSTWCRANWGCKWNASQVKVETDEAAVTHITFQTPWSVPYGVIAAFCNIFRVPFTLRYFDEAPNFWGVEEYGRPEWPKGETRIQRISKRRSHEDDEAPLALLLLGRDLAAEARENDES